MRVRHNDSEKAEDIFCDRRRFLAKVKGFIKPMIGIIIVCLAIKYIIQYF